MGGWNVSLYSLRLGAAGESARPRLGGTPAQFNQPLLHFLGQ